MKWLTLARLLAQFTVLRIGSAIRFRLSKICKILQAGRP